MAERRMFSKSVVLTDKFVEMPISAKHLYFVLNMFADDDGFVDSPRMIMKLCGATNDDIQILKVKGYIIIFESEILVISHWKVNNYIRNDRYKPTLHQNEKASLSVNSEGIYTGIPTGIPTVYPDKDRVVKGSIGEGSGTGARACEAVPEVKPYGKFQNVCLTDEEYSSLKSNYGDIDNLIHELSCKIASEGRRYENHYATLEYWISCNKSRKIEKKPDNESFSTDEFFQTALQNSYKT